MDSALIIPTVILIVLVIPLLLALKLLRINHLTQFELVLCHGEQYRLRTNLASDDHVNHEVFQYNKDTDCFENNAHSVKAELVRVNLIFAEKL